MCFRKCKRAAKLTYLLFHICCLLFAWIKCKIVVFLLKVQHFAEITHVSILINWLCFSQCRSLANVSQQFWSAIKCWCWVAGQRTLWWHWRWRRGRRKIHRWWWWRSGCFHFQSTCFLLFAFWSLLFDSTNLLIKL